MRYPIHKKCALIESSLLPFWVIPAYGENIYMFCFPIRSKEWYCSDCSDCFVLWQYCFVTILFIQWVSWTVDLYHSFLIYQNVFEQFHQPNFHPIIHNNISFSASFLGKYIMIYKKPSTWCSKVVMHINFLSSNFYLTIQRSLDYHTLKGEKLLQI